MHKEFDFSEWCKTNGITPKTASTLKGEDLDVVAGIEITLARSPMTTRFCFGRAENLENNFFFARMASEEFDSNLYFKKVSCLLWVEVVF